MTTPARRPSWLRRQTRTHRWLIVVAIGCAAALVAEIGISEGWFHLGSSTTSANTPNLNPFADNISSVVGSVDYHPAKTGGASQYFPALDNQSLCLCPVSAQIFLNPTNTSQWLVGLEVYFNVTNTATGENAYTLANFSLVNGGSDPHLFTLIVLCCAGTGYQEAVTSVYVTAGTTYGFLAVVFSSTSLPKAAGGGFELYLNATSP